MGQAPRDADGVDFGYGPGERLEAPERPHDAATVLRSIWGDEYEAPSRPQPETDRIDGQDERLPEDVGPAGAAEGIEERLWEVSSRVEQLDRTLRSLIDRLAAVEGQSRASAEVSAEVAAILRELLKPRPVEP